MLQRVHGKALFLFLLMMSSTSAQVDFRHSGYVVDFPVYQRMKSNELTAWLGGIERDQFVNVLRLRLRPSLGLWSGAFLSAEYEVSSLYHSTRFQFLDVTHRAPRQLVELVWTPVRKSNHTVTHFIDRFYLRQTSDIGDFTIGRQRIAWGTGRVWNPTDLFNPINPVTFAKIEKDGADAVLAKLHLGSFTDLSVVLNPEDKFRRTNYGFRFRTNVSEYDLSWMGGIFNERIVLGADFAGNFFDAGVRGEGIFSASKGNLASHFVKFILGIDHQLTPELYAMLEYQYNGEGKTNTREYELIRLARGEILNLSRHYLAAQAMYLFHPLVTGSVMNTLNMNDGSGFTGATISYAMLQDFSISVGGQLFYGDDFDEYRYYPHSMYLRVELFF